MKIAGVLTYGSLRKFPPPPPPLPHAVPNDIPEIPFKVSVKGHHFQYKSFICFGSEDVNYFLKIIKTTSEEELNLLSKNLTRISVIPSGLFVVVVVVIFFLVWGVGRDTKAIGTCFDSNPLLFEIIIKK